MGSVEITWNGQCLDKAKRDDLCFRISNLGELSNDFFKPLVLIKHFDQAIKGNILISSEHFLTAPVSAKLSRVNEKYYSLKKIDLYGVEIGFAEKVYLYPGSRISFVFCVDDDPELEGLLVLTENHEECLKYPDPVIKQADYYLATPNIYLRDRFETWMDNLMGWVKYYYINDLRYWRDFERWVNEQQLADFYRDYGKYEFYEILKNGFENQVIRCLSDDDLLSASDLDLPASIRRLPKELDEY
jgi:hypothetical protein